MCCRRNWLLELKISLTWQKHSRHLLLYPQQLKQWASGYQLASHQKNPHRSHHYVWVYMVFISTYNGHFGIGRKLSLIEAGLQQQPLVTVSLFPTFDKLCVLMSLLIRTSYVKTLGWGFFHYFSSKVEKMNPSKTRVVSKWGKKDHKPSSAKMLKYTEVGQKIVKEQFTKALVLLIKIILNAILLNSFVPPVAACPYSSTTKQRR